MAGGGSAAVSRRVQRERDIRRRRSEAAKKAAATRKKNKQEGKTTSRVSQEVEVKVVLKEDRGNGSKFTLVRQGKQINMGREAGSYGYGGICRQRINHSIEDLKTLLEQLEALDKDQQHKVVQKGKVKSETSVSIRLTHNTASLYFSREGEHIWVGLGPGDKSNKFKISDLRKALEYVTQEMKIVPKNDQKTEKQKEEVTDGSSS